jgi:hypothetical protein
VCPSASKADWGGFDSRQALQMSLYQGTWAPRKPSINDGCFRVLTPEVMSPG